MAACSAAESTGVRVGDGTEAEEAVEAASAVEDTE